MSSPKPTILLVWLEKNTSPRYFVFNRDVLTKEEYSQLHSVANKSFHWDSNDEDDLNMWRVKAAVSSRDKWMPSGIEKSWREKLLPYEVKTTGLTFFSDGPVTLIQIGSI